MLLTVSSHSPAFTGVRLCPCTRSTLESLLSSTAVRSLAVVGSTRVGADRDCPIGTSSTRLVVDWVSREAMVASVASCRVTLVSSKETFSTRCLIVSVMFARKERPLFSRVAVMVVCPFFRPVTVPFSSTVAFCVAEDLKVTVPSAALPARSIVSVSVSPIKSSMTLRSKTNRSPSASAKPAKDVTMIASTIRKASIFFMVITSNWFFQLYNVFPLGFLPAK